MKIEAELANYANEPSAAEPHSNDKPDPFTEANERNEETSCDSAETPFALRSLRCLLFNSGFVMKDFMGSSFAGIRVIRVIRGKEIHSKKRRPSDLRSEGLSASQ
jgi:hypothetical protein